MKLTPIYPAHIKPVRKGVYKVSMERRGRMTYWSYWNGERWGYGYSFAEQALPFEAPQEEHAWQNKRWQGLAAKD